jgi:UDPglucose--hexose-1-phosphate uridylyltransferase
VKPSATTGPAAAATELRWDPLSGRPTIIAARRGDRPGGGFAVGAPESLDPASDPFLAGHEDRTPPELAGGPGWRTRVVPNLYPLTARHEVIVQSPDPLTSLSSLASAQLAATVGTWRARLREHADASYRHLFVNEGRQAGASLAHTHAQLVVLDVVPPLIEAEVRRFRQHAEDHGGRNLLGDVLAGELEAGERVVATSAQAVLLTPYASRHPFQLMIVPWAAEPRFEDSACDPAPMLEQALARLQRRFGASPPLNLWVRTAPRTAGSYCWRIDIVPRLSQLAGVELGLDVGVCTVSPEDAAAQLRALDGGIPTPDA